MANSYNGVLLFYDWERPLSKIPPEDFKRIVMAMFAYQARGEELPPLESFEDTASSLVADFIFPQIERRVSCSKAGKKGMEARWGKTAGNGVISGVNNNCDNDGVAHRQDIDINTDIDKNIDEISPPIPPSRGDGDGQSAISALIDGAALSDTVKAKLREWLAYRGKSAYKLAGVKALISRTCKNVNAHGDAAVCDLIDDSMANGYKGIIWEKFNRMSGGSPANEIMSNLSDKLLEEKMGF